MPSPDRGNKTAFFLFAYFMASQFMLGGFVGGLAVFGVHVNVLVLTAAGLLIGLGLPFFFYLRIAKRKWREVLPLNPIKPTALLLVVITAFAVIPMVHTISRITAFVFSPIIVDLMSDLEALPMWFGLLVIGVLPSIVEEIWFRGAIYREYEGLSVKHKAILTGVFFGMLHMNYHQFVYAALFGILWAYMLHYTKNFFVPMLMHFINNGVSTLMSYSQPFTEWYDNLWDQPAKFLLILGGVSAAMLPVVWLCLRQLKKGSEDHEPEPEGDPPLYAKPKLITGAAWGIIAFFVVFATGMEIMMRVDFDQLLSQLLTY
jgi:membrane protease YdiL (CAAX protease family)